jgi:hypothetical protein
MRRGRSRKRGSERENGDAPCLEDGNAPRFGSRCHGCWTRTGQVPNERTSIKVASSAHAQASLVTAFSRICREPGDTIARIDMAEVLYGQQAQGGLTRISILEHAGEVEEGMRKSGGNSEPAADCRGRWSFWMIGRSPIRCRFRVPTPQSEMLPSPRHTSTEPEPVGRPGGSGCRP